jgi:hypothetical protein
VFDAQMKFTGRQYTPTFAWLAMGAIFIPAVTIVVSPGYLGLSLAGIGIIACIALAWVTWKKSSRLAIPSIAKSQSGSNE